MMLSEAKKFHRYARECLQLAEQAAEPDIKKSLIELSHIWMEAALEEERHILRTRVEFEEAETSQLIAQGVHELDDLVMQSSIPMGDEHSPIRDLKHRWDEEDKTRDELERQAQASVFGARSK